MIWNPWREIKRLQEYLATSSNVVENLRHYLLHEQRHIAELKKEIAKYEHALRDIADMETPRCSNVVRKAARVAREALHK